MQIRQIRLSNVKTFRHGVTNLDLQRADGTLPGWIVVAGRNGAGKSSFLQAIALAVAGPSMARTLRTSFADWIRDGELQASTLVQLNFSDQESFGPGRRPAFEPWAGLKWSRMDDGPEPAIERARQGGAWEPSRGPWAENPQGWFLCGYGPFRRTSVAAGDDLRLMMTPGRASALASLFQEGVSLSEGVQWLQQIYLKRLEGSPTAAAVEHVVLRLLDDGLLPEGVKVSHITSEGLWVKTPNGTTLPLRALSDGYRTIAALVIDIMRHLLHAYGDLDPIEDSDHVTFGHAGVVLIDEIDVHLHVSWQQRIGFWMKDHFPNIQFIVSTHSPFICQAADENGLIRLPAPGEDEGATLLAGEAFNRVVNGTADDAILTDLFGLETPYSAESVKLREKASHLEHAAAEGRISSGEATELKTLRSKLPRTPSKDVSDAIQQLTLALDYDAQN